MAAQRAAGFTIDGCGSGKDGSRRTGRHLVSVPMFAIHPHDSRKTRTFVPSQTLRATRRRRVGAAASRSKGGEGAVRGRAPGRPAAPTCCVALVAAWFVRVGGLKLPVAVTGVAIVGLCAEPYENARRAGRRFLLAPPSALVRLPCVGWRDRTCSRSLVCAYSRAPWRRSTGVGSRCGASRSPSGCSAGQMRIPSFSSGSRWSPPKVSAPVHQWPQRRVELLGNVGEGAGLIVGRGSGGGSQATGWPARGRWLAGSTTSRRC